MRGDKNGNIEFLTWSKCEEENPSDTTLLGRRGKVSLKTLQGVQMIGQVLGGSHCRESGRHAGGDTIFRRET